MLVDPPPRPKPQADAPVHRMELEWPVELDEDEIAALKVPYMDALTVDIDPKAWGRLGPQRDGVCRAMSLHWLGRIVHDQVSPVPPSYAYSNDEPGIWVQHAKCQAEKVQANLDDAHLVLVNGFEPILGRTLDEKTFKMRRRLGSEIVPEFLGELEPGKCYIIGLRTGYGAQIRGHTAALSAEDGAARFMDPNLGEYHFPLHTEREATRFVEFLSKWYDTFAPSMGDDLLLFGEVRAA